MVDARLQAAQHLHPARVIDDPGAEATTARPARPEAACEPVLGRRLLIAGASAALAVGALALPESAGAATHTGWRLCLKCRGLFAGKGTDSASAPGSGADGGVTIAVDGVLTLARTELGAGEPAAEGATEREAVLLRRPPRPSTTPVARRPVLLTSGPGHCRRLRRAAHARLAAGSSHCQTR
jgi:hypothetical protein